MCYKALTISMTTKKVFEFLKDWFLYLHVEAEVNEVISRV